MSQTLRLDGGGQSLVVVIESGRPRLAYWGPALPEGDRGRIDPRLLERAIPHGMLDAGEAFDLLPEAGLGFTGHAALEFHRPGGGFISQMSVVAAEIQGARALIGLADPQAAIAVDLEIEMDPATGVAAFRSVLHNRADQPLVLGWLAAVALPGLGDEILAFGGRWSREFEAHRFPAPPGVWISESRTGRTSHHAPSFLVLGESGFGDDHGELLGLHLAWSGDHRLLVERLRDGRLQLQAGELLAPGEITLAAGDTYATPWLYASRSDAGLNGLSDRLHPFVRDRVLGGRLRGKPRPVHFNTWEAVYFRHEAAELEALVEVAAQVGAERFVLDDGWFRGRDDDTTSLGDWTPDPRKYPQGLGPLIDHVRARGLEFGLWVEPEMANAQSDLLRAHPDWILGEPGRTQPLGRGQYVLDLTRPEVAEAIFGQLHALLCAHPIGYLKWDMNRDLTHPMSQGRPASRDQVLAVYALIDRVRAAHPELEIESCASGGGRADYEILRRADRIWTSDCNDPLERQSIQAAFSIFFPPEVMGAHVGPAQSHTTARRTSLEMRALTALFGHMGVEADLAAFSDADVTDLARHIALHKTLRPLLHGGRRLRQRAPDPGAIAFLVLGEQGALASVAQLATPTSAGMDPLRLQGLDPDRLYGISLLNPPRRPHTSMKSTPALLNGETLRATGLQIARIGLSMPILRAGQMAVFHLTPVAPEGVEA